MANLALGVSGSIAAYKAAELASQLSKSHNVAVVMTPNAARFVGPLTFQTLTRNPVTVDVLPTSTAWVPEHVKLAQTADLFVVAPATANILAKMAQGLADCALSTALLTHTGTVVAAPAMNTRMWEHPATKANVQTLKDRGVIFVAPDSGDLACGETGEGRLAEVPAILEAIHQQLS